MKRSSYNLVASKINMLSKNKIKYIHSLSRKKVRDETGLFIAEGEKIIAELIQSGFNFELLVLTKDRIDAFPELHCERLVSTSDEIKKISLLTTPTPIVAVCQQPNYLIHSISAHNDLTIALDNIQDPGNLGTIIRMASWFGIVKIVCSENSVDCYNPKVIQATMGAIAHVNVYYTNLTCFLKHSKEQGREIYGTFMEGESIYKTTLKENGIIVMGNEGKGISDEIENEITKKITIPSFSNGKYTTESLNVSIAASIVCSEFRRRRIQLS
jgi:TrmH family RNA methyltransferase